MKDKDKREDHSTVESENNIHTDFSEQMTYGEYLNLNKILSSQKTLSGHHDEMLFIIIHQTMELWMKLILHELNAAIESIEKEDLQTSFKQLARVTKIESQIIQSWDVLSTLTPSEYIEFRDSLGQASGFQSFQYRQIEFALGYKTPHILKIYKEEPKLFHDLEKAYRSPGLYDVSIKALSLAGFSIDKEIMNRDYSTKYESNESVRNAWLAVYKDKENNWELYQLAEKLVDIEDLLQQWRFRHMKTVERIIGFKKGTGGSSGINYLKKVLDHYFFPELWEIRTEL